MDQELRIMWLYRKYRRHFVSSSLVGLRWELPSHRGCESPRAKRFNWLSVYGTLFLLCQNECALKKTKNLNLVQRLSTFVVNTQVGLRFCFLYIIGFYIDSYLFFHRASQSHRDYLTAYAQVIITVFPYMDRELRIMWFYIKYLRHFVQCSLVGLRWELLSPRGRESPRAQSLHYLNV